MSKEMFHDALFDLADIWTDGVDEELYVQVRS